MLDTLRISPKAGSAFTSTVSDLLQSTSRILILTVGSICVFWYALAILIPQWIDVLPAVFYVTVVVLTFSALAYALLPKRLLAAQLVWLAGLTGAITLAIYLFRIPEIAAAYALLPLLTTLVMGRVIGLVTQGGVILLVLGISRAPSLPALPTAYAITVMVAGGFVGILGWVATRALLMVTEWSLFSFEQARQRMDEALEQKVELKQAQEDLVQANRELARLTDRLTLLQRTADEARQAKEEFVANVSHELRTPLNMIIGFSEVITRSPKIYGMALPSALLADIATIQRNSQHLAKLVNDVLDLSQVDAGRMAISKEWINIKDIVESALTVVQPLFASKDLYLKAEVDAGLPDVFCDGTRIRQVVINLLSNAGRFTEDGGVLARAFQKNGKIVIGVADTGPGISPKNQSRLFEPFQQLDASIRRRHGGSGLGLSISKRFVELHGGKIWIESPSSVRQGNTGGPGTHIQFSLPVAPPPSSSLNFEDARRWFDPYSSHPDKIRTRRSKAPTTQIMPRYILLEEGNALQRLLTRYMPEVDLIATHNVQDAREELERLPADAVIVNESGSGTIPCLSDQLTDLPFGTPVLSCWVPEGDEIARQLGGYHYLVKPVSADDLLTALEELGSDIRRILLVDDEPQILQLFSRFISATDHDYQILRALHGQRALQLLRTRQPDVMLLDLIMPGVDGFQVLREKAKDPTIHDIPVIIISSKSPAGGPIVSNALTVKKGEGLSVRELVAGIQSLSDILVPSVWYTRQAPLTEPAE